MAGRFAYFLIAGGALVTGMFAQGDLGIDGDEVERELSALVDDDVSRANDRQARATVRVSGDVVTDQETKRALSQAIAELVRAEGSLIALRMEDATPEAAISRALERRDAAKRTVEQLADQAKAESTGNRDAIRQIIRDEVREAARS